VTEDAARAAADWHAAGRPASLVMERKMLHGIEERAERLAAERPVEA
jgi:hypothetical protein